MTACGSADLLDATAVNDPSHDCLGNAQDVVASPGPRGGRSEVDDAFFIFEQTYHGVGADFELLGDLGNGVEPAIEIAGRYAHRGVVRSLS